MSVDYESKKTKLEDDLKKLKQDFKDLKAVSYTHLTLPTKA